MYLNFVIYIGSDAGRWKTLGVPVVIGGDNLPSPVGIGLTDLPNIGGGSVAPLAPPVPASLHRYLQLYLLAGGVNVGGGGQLPSIFWIGRLEGAAGYYVLLFSQVLGNYWHPWLLLKGTFINYVPSFLAIFDLPTYLVILYNVPFLGQSWTPYLPYYGTALMNIPKSNFAIWMPMKPLDISQY